MKKLFAMALVLISVCAGKAQNWDVNHEFFVSYGIGHVGNFPDMRLPYNSMASAPYSLADAKRSGTINAGYMIHFSTPFAMGLSYSYSTCKGDIYLGSSIKLGEAKTSCHTIMLTGKYDWLKLSQFRFYSRVGAGILLQSATRFSNFDSESKYATMPEDKLSSGFAWQVMPLGIDWQMIPHFTLFAEGGVGTLGCCMAGVKAIF